MFPLVNILRHWWHYLLAQHRILFSSPRRLGRFLVAVVGQLLVAAVAVASYRELAAR
jgi:hypothetical protein